MKKLEKIILLSLGLLLLVSTSIGFYRLVKQNSITSQYVWSVLTEYEISSLKFESMVYRLALSKSALNANDFEKQLNDQETVLKNLKSIINSYSEFLSTLQLDDYVKNYITASEKTLNKLALWKQEYQQIHDISESSLNAIETNFSSQHKLYKKNKIEFMKSEITEIKKNVMISGIIIILAWAFAIFLTYQFCRNKFGIIIDRLKYNQHKKIRISVGGKNTQIESFVQSSNEKQIVFKDNHSENNIDINLTSDTGLTSNNAKTTSNSFPAFDIKDSNDLNYVDNSDSFENSNSQLKSNSPSKLDLQHNYNNATSTLNMKNEKTASYIMKTDSAIKTFDSDNIIVSNNEYAESKNHNENSPLTSALTGSSSNMISKVEIEKLENELSNLKTTNYELQKINSDIKLAYEKLKSEYNSESLKQKEEASKKLMHEIQETITTNQKDTEQAKELVIVFDESSKILKTANDRIIHTNQNITQISEIGELTDGIAERIKMLSMNAAIEAAHAGNVGKGFAVVAEEMGRLAEEAAENSQDISKTVKSVVKDITFIGKSGGDLEKLFEKLNLQTGKVYESIQNFSEKIKTNYEEYQKISDE